jgi:putative membrane protein
MTVHAEGRPARHRPRIRWRSHPFNWRVMVARFVIYGLSLYLANLILPGFVIKPYKGEVVYSVLVLAAVFGIINAIFKPFLLFLALPFLIQTAGLIVLVVNIILFALLDAFADNLIDMQGVGWFFLGGIVVGLLAFVFENVFGVPEPILSDIPPDAEGEPS